MQHCSIELASYAHKQNVTEARLQLQQDCFLGMYIVSWAVLFCEVLKWHLIQKCYIWSIETVSC